MSSRHLTDEELSAFLDGEGEHPERVSRHMGECAGCRGRFEAMRRLSLQLHTLPVPELRHDFARRVIAEVRPHGRAQNISFRRYAYSALALAASLLLLLSAWLATRDNEPLTPGVPSVAETANSMPEETLVAAVEHEIGRIPESDVWSLESFLPVEEENATDGEELVLSLADAGCFDSFSTEVEEDGDLDSALAELNDSERQAFKELLQEYQRGEVTL